MIPAVFALPPSFGVKDFAAHRGGSIMFDGLDFTLASGDALLVTGVNGSGKSSLLRALAGLLPAGGTAFWQCERIGLRSLEHRTHLAYIGHLDALKPELTVAAQITYWQALDPNLTAKPSTTALEFFDLNALRDCPVRLLSAGQKRRLSLCRLLLTAAPLWLLDEPATALDATGQQRLEDLIAAHRKSGGMVILATHQALALPDATRLDMNNMGSAVTGTPTLSAFERDMMDL